MKLNRSIVTSFLLPVIVIFGVIILLINNQRELPGELVLEQEKIDFGEVPEWEGLVKQSVTGRNVGKSKLTIERIETGCSYAKIEGPQVLQPGEEGVFRVVFNPEVLPADAKPATAILFTDSPRTRQVYLTIAAAAKRFATLSAEICDFGEIAPNTVHEKKVKLCVNAPMNRDGIRLMPSSHPSLKWEMASESSSDCFLITVKLGPLKDKAPFASTLTVALPNERTLTLPVAARVVSPVKVQPETLFYGAVAQGDEPSAEFTLEAKTPFKVLKIQTPDVLTVSTPPDNRSPNRFTAMVKWHTKDSPLILRKEIRVMTSAAPEPIHIPVYGLIGSSEPEKPLER